MPITDEARELMKATTADMTNHSKNPYGNAIKAAAFLERFIEEDTKWVHCDIAGSSGHSNPKSPICPGFNGYGT